MLPISGGSNNVFEIKCFKFNTFSLLILTSFLILGSCGYNRGSVAGGGAIEIVADKGCITISINHQQIRCKLFDM